MSTIKVAFTTDQATSTTAIAATGDDMQAIVELFTEARPLNYLGIYPVARFWAVYRILEINREDGWHIILSDEDSDDDLQPRPSLTDEVWMQLRNSVRRIQGPPRPNITVRHVVMSRAQEEIASLAFLIICHKRADAYWSLNLTRGQQKQFSAQMIGEAQRLLTDDRERALDIIAGVHAAYGWPAVCWGIESDGTAAERRSQLDCLLNARLEDLIFCRQFECESLVAASDPYLMTHQESDDERAKRRLCGEPRIALHSWHKSVKMQRRKSCMGLNRYAEFTTEADD